MSTRTLMVRIRGIPVSWLMPLLLVGAAFGQDVSAPAILQDFENGYSTIQGRMADVFSAGYGSIYTPPPGRADSGNQSVGYDVYDRFDLGSAGNPTLYGTQAGLQSLVAQTHQAGLLSYVDLVWNHDGFSDSNTASGAFARAGGYPGFALSLQSTNPSAPNYNVHGINDPSGDFHPASATGDLNGRLDGLIDIAQEKNYQLIRNPVTPGDPLNVPAGSVPWNGRLANVPMTSNAQYYPDESLQPIVVSDPATGQQNLRIYPFNLNDPIHGTPVPENALGYLMRNAQWLVQAVGVDGFRLDATKNYPTWVLKYYDRAVYRSSFRSLLNGQQEQIFGFSEYFDGNAANIQTVIRKDLNPGTPSVVGGNRDALDFSLYFAMQQNLTGNGLQNDWTQLHNAGLDYHDDGLHNGSQGVTFVQDQDVSAPYLSNVAYAYTLMMPGNTVVYFNGHEFGASRSFPKDGRTDALGGYYGNGIPALVDLRNRYGRGNYHEDFIEKENFAFERQGSALVMLSNRLDAGFDSRTIDVGFAPGTPLIELTGNAHGPAADPHGDIPQLIIVNADPHSPTGASVNARFLRNATLNLQGTSVFTGDGYLVYGLPTPQGSLTVSNVAQIMAGGTPAASSYGTTRLANIDVIKSNGFAVGLNTVAANLLGFYRDRPADGDNALLKLDGGIDLNGNGTVDFTTPNTATYGFEKFTTIHQPGYSDPSGNGRFVQNVEASTLADGYHYLEVIAFRHRDDGGPPVYSDWRQTIYLDRNQPTSRINGFNPIGGASQNRELAVQSVDGLANNVHVLLDLPAALSDAQVLAKIGGSTQAKQLDVNLWAKDLAGVTSGNHSATVVTFKPDGNYNVQRFAANAVPALSTSTTVGAGLGDLNFDHAYTRSDVDLFRRIYYSHNTQFNPAADFNGDGLVDRQDVGPFGHTLRGASADSGTLADFGAPALPGDLNGDGRVDFQDFNILAAHFGQSGATWATGDINGDGTVNFADFNLLASDFGQRLTSSEAARVFAFGQSLANAPAERADVDLLAQRFSDVPEPTTLGCILMVARLLRRERRMTRIPDLGIKDSA